LLVIIIILLLELSYCLYAVIKPLSRLVWHSINMLMTALWGKDQSQAPDTETHTHYITRPCILPIGYSVPHSRMLLSAFQHSCQSCLNVVVVTTLAEGRPVRVKHDA